MASDGGGARVRRGGTRGGKMDVRNLWVSRLEDRIRLFKGVEWRGNEILSIGEQEAFLRFRRLVKGSIHVNAT